MAFADRYHINPVSGEIGRCSAEFGKCPFGSIDHHFRNEADARRAFENKMVTFEEWTLRSNVPQIPGWHTEHVFDPNRPESYERAATWLGKDIPTGTRLVLENGWVFQKSNVGTFWDFAEGVDSRSGGFRREIKVIHYQFMPVLENYGGRLEFTEGVQPIKVNWRA